LYQERIDEFNSLEMARIEAYEAAKELNDTLHAEWTEWQLSQDALRANNSDWMTHEEQQAALAKLEAENAAKAALEALENARLAALEAETTTSSP